jgi:hypothetical protein
MLGEYGYIQFSEPHQLFIGTRTGRANLSWLVPGMYLCLFACFSWWNSNTRLDVGLAKYGTVLLQWYVVHSYERRLAGSMIDDNFVLNFYSQSCFQNAACKGCRCGLTCQSQIMGAQKQKSSLAM